MESSINTTGTLLLYAGIIVVMFSMGLQTTRGQIWAALRRRRLMATAVAANLIVLPLAAAALSRLVAMPPEITAGFLIAAAAPGASLSPKLSEIAGADLSFAVGLLFALAVLSVVATPLLAGWLLPDSPNLQFEPLRIIGVLICFQLFPLLAGLAVHHRRPGLAGRLRRPSILLANVLFAAIVAFYLIRDFAAVRMLPLPSVAAMVLMTFISLAVGWWLGGPDKATRQTLALGTSVEFAGLALLITTLSFPGTLASITVVAFGLIMILINTKAALGWRWRDARAVQAPALLRQPAAAPGGAPGEAGGRWRVARTDRSQ